MGDHFVLLVDRLLTESSLEAAIESKNQLQHATPSASENMVNDFSSRRMDVDIGSSPRKMVQCRICHDEDEDSKMEIPCSCCGSLKYAHRKCVQRWCDEKGDIICEICRQQFKPGYTAPPPLFHYGAIPMDFRGNWEVSRRDLHNPQFITTVATDRIFLGSNFDDYSSPTSRSQICCRVVAIMFMVLLVLRHTLLAIISGAGDYKITLFMLLMLRTIGILLPIYIMIKAFTAIQRRRHQQLCTLGCCKGNMSGMEDVKDHERVDGAVTEDSEKAMPTPQQEEEAVKNKYGGIMRKKPPLISKDHERAYFDSADWALGKQGVEKPKGPLPLRPKLQPTQQQTRYRKSPYAPSDGEGGNAPSEDASANE